MNLSNTHGDSKYNCQANVNQKSPKGSPMKSSRRNVRAKVVRNSNSIYGKSQAVEPSKPVSLINLAINTVFRVTIVGVGMGTLFGTFLANRDLTQPLFPEIELPFLAKIFPPMEKSSETEVTSNTKLPEVQEKPVEKNTSNKSVTAVNFSKEDTKLKNKFKQLTAQYPQHEPGAFFVDLDNGVYVNFNGIKAFPSGSARREPLVRSKFLS